MITDDNTLLRIKMFHPKGDGLWVRGTCLRQEFTALVLPAGTTHHSHEVVPGSGIRTLRIKRRHRVLASFDGRWNRKARDHVTRFCVAFLATFLADAVFGPAATRRH